MNITRLLGELLSACSRGEPHADLKTAKQEMYDFHQARLREMDPELRRKMVAALKALIHEQYLSLAIRELIAIDPLGWSVPLHFSWGMEVRILLRERGFTEAATGIGNLDNVYIPLVEEAVKED